ncbi:hypothetical protein H7F33_10165 [Pedobacter sp. PAMC26386]|nr:hypothetical protein H7F33_10165 [Pedobacter sp. PAMC26386]
MNKEELRKIFNQKKQKTDPKTLKIIDGFMNATFNEFQNWFKMEKFIKGCHYCGTSNEKSFELYQLQRTGLRPDATRGGKRGKRLELDRKDPFKSYDDLDNVVWCCYWCNNAKSNFFTAEEFMLVAKAIGEAIKKII